MGDWSMRMTLSMFSAPDDGFVVSGFFARAVQLAGECAIENVIDQR